MDKREIAFEGFYKIFENEMKVNNLGVVAPLNQVKETIKVDDSLVLFSGNYSSMTYNNDEMKLVVINSKDKGYYATLEHSIVENSRILLEPVIKEFHDYCLNQIAQKNIDATDVAQKLWEIDYK